VTNPRYPLRVNVGFLLNQTIGTYRDIHFELPDYQFSQDFSVAKLEGVTRIMRVTQGLLVDGSFQTHIQLECVRCLTDYTHTLQCEFQELYAFRNQPATESGLIVPDNANIDFAPVIHEYLVLEIPIKPLCRPDCRGLCVVCGENLNTSDCGHDQTIILEE
jgi:uncharacterized protein